MGEEREVSNVFLATFFSMLVVLLLFVSYIVFIPSVNYKLKETFRDKVELSTDFSGGGIYWDKVDHVLKMSFKRGYDGLELRKLRFQFYYGDENFEHTINRVPFEGGSAVHSFIFGSYNEAPDVIVVSPIIGGLEKEFILRINREQIVEKDIEMDGSEILLDEFKGGYILGL